MMKQILTVFALYLFLLPVLPGQAGFREADTLPRYELNFMFNVAMAQGLFAEHLDKETGSGYGLEFYMRIKNNAPLLAGITSNWFTFDRYTIRYEDFYDGVFSDYREKTASRLLQFSPGLRFEPEVRFAFQPYIQGNAGLNIFYTNTKIRDLDAQETVDIIREQRQAKFFFGASIGLRSQMFTQYGDFLFFDIRTGYLRNASTEFMRFNPELVDDVGFPADFFERKNAPVDLWTIQLGMTIQF